MKCRDLCLHLVFPALSPLTLVLWEDASALSKTGAGRGRWPQQLPCFFIENTVQHTVRRARRSHPVLHLHTVKRLVGSGPQGKTLLRWKKRRAKNTGLTQCTWLYFKSLFWCHKDPSPSQKYTGHNLFQVMLQAQP